MASLGDIVIGLKMDAAPFSANARRAQGGLDSIAASARSAATQLLSMIGTGSAIGGIGWGVKLAADAEQAQIAFEVMLGSADKAKALLASLKQFSDKSPFDSIVPREAAQTLLNFGVASDQIMATIRMLGDVAAGDGQKLKQLSLVFGQMSATGRLMGQDLLQFINAGFNPLQQISARTGESMATLKKRMEAGGISAQEVTQAFRDATGAGGRFFGMTERQSSSLTGLWSTTKDTLISTLTEIGAQMITSFDLKGVLQSLIYWLGIISDLTQKYGSDVLILVKILGGMAVAVAVVRAALLAYSTVQSILIAKELVLKSLMGPKGWAMIAAAVVGAGVVFNQLSHQFDTVAKNARKAATEVEAVANAGTSGKGAKQILAPVDQLIALQKRMRELQRESRTDPEGARGKAQKAVSAVNIPELLGIQKTGQAAAEASPRVKLLRDALASLSDWRGLMAPEEIAAASKIINEALAKERDAASGITDAIAKQREELQKLKEDMDPNAQGDRFKGAGASAAALAQLQALKEETEELRRQKKLRDDIAEEQKSRQQEMQAKADRLKESTMTAAQKQAQELREIQELFIQGFIDEGTFNRANAEVGKKKKKEGKVGDASAAIAGSSEAAQTVLRGAFGSKSLESLAQRGNQLAERHLALAQAEANKTPQVLRIKMEEF